MKLTSKGRYAVMAMADLAKNNAKKPTSLTEISLRQGISIAYLEQLFLKLRKNNLVLSSRGPSGGYVLSKPPGEIKLLSIINAVDEKIKTVKCKKESKKGCNGKSIKCITHNLWDDLENHINKFFEDNKRQVMVELVKSRREQTLSKILNMRGVGALALGDLRMTAKNINEGSLLRKIERFNIDNRNLGEVGGLHKN